MSKGGGSGISGYRYYFDLLIGLCRGPIDRLVAIRVGDYELWPGLPYGTTVTSPQAEQALLRSLFNPGSAQLAPITPIAGFAGEVVGAPVTGTQGFSITAPTAFGGDTGEGGVVGSAAMLMGDPDQVIPPDIKKSISTGTQGHTYVFVDGGSDVQNDWSRDTGIAGDYTIQAIEDISEFRGVATIFYTGLVCSNNPYPKAWKFRIQRAVKGWDAATGGCWLPDFALITMQDGTVGAMNPAHILYQCLTDPAWGRGMKRAELDDASWRYAAEYLYAEQFGLCATWNRDSDINQFIQMVIDHIGASMYVDRSTGLMVLRLIRNDYDAATLPIFGYNSGLLKVEVEETGASSIITNEVVVKYQNPIIDQERQIRVQNLASIQAIGCVVSETKSYSACPDPGLARRLALRDLQAGSAGLKRFKLQCDRRAWRLQPGSVIRIQALDKGIVDIVLRIATYDDGTAANGTIKMDCVQDVFGLPSTLFTAEPTGGWVGPQSNVPPALPRQLVTEASYYDMVRGLTPAEMASVTPDEGGVVAMAARPNANTLSTVLAVTPTGGQASLAGNGSFAPAASTRGPVGFYDTVIPLQGGSDLSRVAVGSMALLGNEMIRVDALDLTAGVLTAGRGCGDTVPTTHPKSTLIYFTAGTATAHTQTYAAGETVQTQLLSRTMRGVQNPAAATTASVTITGRWAKPYPMGNMRINGQPGLFAAPVAASGDVALTWAGRNKVIEADQLIDQTAGPILPEAGTTATVEVWDRGRNVRLRAHEGITEAGWTYTDAEAQVGPDPSGIDLVVFTVLAGRASYTGYRLPLIYRRSGAPTGYGEGYGYGYGQASGTQPPRVAGYGNGYGTSYGKAA